MEEYNIFRIECDKNESLIDINEKIASKFRYKRHLFEITGLTNRLIELMPKEKDTPEDLDIQEYAFSYVLPHILNSEYYNPDRDTIHAVSNLDKDCWNYGNPNNNDNISDQSFKKLLSFCGKLKPSMFSTWLLGIDMIEWGGEPVGEGTYGYEKARSTYRQGENYLSNSVLISKLSINSAKIVIHLSCESKYRNLDVVNELISSLGKVKSEKELYAPSDNKERIEWNRIKATMESKFSAFLDKMKELIPSLPYQLEKKTGFGYPKNTINIRKLEKEILCVDGWKIKKNDQDLNCAIVTSKTIDDCEFKVHVAPLHGGHHLQTIFMCSSPAFLVGKNLSFSARITGKDEAIKYLESIKILREHFVEEMMKE